MPFADVVQHATQLRRRLHRIPELGYEERETAAIIRAELERLKIAYLAGPAAAPTATIAVLGDVNRPCILLRADIDALPIEEQTGAAHASTYDGRMHACGHDGHTANLLGVAAVLKEEIDSLPVCVKLVWQPAEEGGGGGRRLVEAGVLEEGALGPKVVAAFGLHGWPALPLGSVTTRPGPLLAATDTFELAFSARGGHAAQPHMTADPLMTAASAVVNLQQFVSRDIDPTEPAVLSVTRFHAGSANNIIASEALIGGTARTLSPETRAAVKAAVERRARGLAEAGRCELKFTWNQGYPPTVNDPAMAQFVADTARRTLGPDAFIPAARATMGGEDFAYYLEKVPGCFFFIGLCPGSQAEYPPLHTPGFDFVDAALETGISLMCALARSFPT